jgi:hypothetical protein
MLPNDQSFIINGRSYVGDELGEYLAMKIAEAFELYESDLHPALFNYQMSSSPRDLPFDETYQSFHKVIEVELKTLSLNKVS